MSKLTIISEPSKKDVYEHEGQPVTNSLLVAEKFSKQHKDVMRSIKELLTSAQNCANLFAESAYQDAYGRNQPMYLMNRDGFTLLVMGFTGEKALQFKIDYINAFNKMEEAIRFGGFKVPATLSDALRLAAEQADKIEDANRQIEAMRPKEVFTDAVTGSHNSCLIGELAKLLRQNGIGIGEKRLFQWMRDNGYLGRCGERYNIPNQLYVEQGLFELKKGVRSGSNGVLHTTVTPKVTGKGQVYFINKFLARKAV